jgi:hypothetical protein
VIAHHRKSKMTAPSESFPEIPSLHRKQSLRFVHTFGVQECLEMRLTDLFEREGKKLVPWI